MPIETPKQLRTPMANFRAKYPQYEKWSNEKIAHAIRTKFPKYGDWSDDKLAHALDAKFGLKQIGRAHV